MVDTREGAFVRFETQTTKIVLGPPDGGIMAASEMVTVDASHLDVQGTGSVFGASFAGDLAFTNPAGPVVMLEDEVPADGAFSGHFFGPGAEEVGGLYEAADERGRVIGAFGGRILPDDK